MQLKRFALGVLLIFGCLVPASLRAQDPMMQQLPIDPAVRMGTLPNLFSKKTHKPVLLTFLSTWPSTERRTSPGRTLSDSWSALVASLGQTLMLTLHLTKQYIL